MLEFTENFSMTFAENRTYGVPEFAGTEVNRHSGKLKGLSGYLQNHYPRWTRQSFWEKGVSQHYISSPAKAKLHSRTTEAHMRTLLDETENFGANTNSCNPKLHLLVVLLNYLGF